MKTYCLYYDTVLFRREEPIGGLSRFKTAVNQLREKYRSSPPLLLFSGDAFSPSTQSTITKGKHMVHLKLVF